MSLRPVKQALLRELIYILNLSENLESANLGHLNHLLTEAVHVGGPIDIFIMKTEKGPYFKIVASSASSLIHTEFISYLQLQTAIKQGEGTFIRYSYSDATKKYTPYVYLAKVIQSKTSSEPIGVIVVVANIEEQLNNLIEKANPSQNMKFAILNSDGIVIDSTDRRLQGDYFDPISPKRRKEIEESRLIGVTHLAAQPIPVIKSEDPQFFEFVFNNQVNIAYRAYVPIGNVSVMSYSAKEEFFGTAVRHFLFIYIIYGLILVIGGGIAYWLSLWISRPLTQLSHLMEKVSQGDLNVRFKEEPLGFEINILGKIFNHTIDHVLENMQRAEDEKVKMEVYQKELTIVRRVQRSVISDRIPLLEGAEFASIYLPAIDVGGDFYGYRKKTTKSGEEALLVVVGDVAGRGISSCLYSYSMRSFFKTYGTLFDNLGEILSFGNNAFIQHTGDTGMFVTLFYGLYFPRLKTLSYYSCGHVPCFVKRADGELITLASSGIAIGLKEFGPLHTDSIQLASGDTLFMYTKGLTNAKNEQQECFSERRLKHYLQMHQWTSAKQAIDEMSGHAHNFTHSTPQEEEIIIVVLHIK